MLLDIHIHDTFFSSLFLDLREQGCLFHPMMAVENFVPALCVLNEVCFIFWADVQSLLVDAVQATDDHVVTQGHDTSCLSILIVWFL